MKAFVRPVEPVLLGKWEAVTTAISPGWQLTINGDTMVVSDGNDSWDPVYLTESQATRIMKILNETGWVL